MVKKALLFSIFFCANISAQEYQVYKIVPSIERLIPYSESGVSRSVAGIFYGDGNNLIEKAEINIKVPYFKKNEVCLEIVSVDGYYYIQHKLKNVSRKKIKIIMILKNSQLIINKKIKDFAIRITQSKNNKNCFGDDVEFLNYSWYGSEYQKNVVNVFVSNNISTELEVSLNGESQWGQCDHNEGKDKKYNFLCRAVFGGCGRNKIYLRASDKYESEKIYGNTNYLTVTNFCEKE